jgi:hypothetical protein
MSTKVIPLSRLEEDPRSVLTECLDTETVVVVEMPDRRLVAIQSLEPSDEEDDFINDLIDSNPAFRALVARSKAGPRVPFSVEDEDGPRRPDPTSNPKY